MREVDGILRGKFLLWQLSKWADFSFVQIKYPEDIYVGVERRASKMPPSHVEYLLLEMKLQVLTQKRAFRAYQLWVWLKCRKHQLLKHAVQTQFYSSSSERLGSDSFTSDSALVPIAPGSPSSSWPSKMESGLFTFSILVLFLDNKTNKQCNYHFQ